MSRLSSFEVLTKLQEFQGIKHNNENDHMKFLSRTLKECAQLLSNAESQNTDSQLPVLQPKKASIQELEQSNHKDKINTLCKALQRIGKESLQDHFGIDKRQSRELETVIPLVLPDEEHIDEDTIPHLPDFIRLSHLSGGSGANQTASRLNYHCALRELAHSSNFEPWMGRFRSERVGPVVLRGGFKSIGFPSMSSEFQPISLFVLWAIGEALTALKELELRSSYSLQSMIEPSSFQVTMARDKVYLSNIPFGEEMKSPSIDSEEYSQRDKMLAISFQALLYALKFPTADLFVFDHRQLSEGPVSTGFFHMFWVPIGSPIPGLSRQPQAIKHISVRIRDMDSGPLDTRVDGLMVVEDDDSGSPMIFHTRKGRAFIGFTTLSISGNFQVHISCNEREKVVFQVCVSRQRFAPRDHEVDAFSDYGKKIVFQLAQQLTRSQANENWRVATG